MILTGSEIAREHAAGRITIEPFEPSQVNPNSYNFRLGRKLRVYTKMPLDPRHPSDYEELDVPDEGYVLEPGRLYLAHTEEVLGGRCYAPTFAARSSVARLGLFINLSASLGDIGYEGQWTLQLFTMNRVRVYPGMNIGQMMWWRPQGEVELYDGKYQGSVGPRSSDIHRDFERKLARHRLPGLETIPDPGQVGAKFASLAAASRSAAVPAAFSVPVAFAVPAAELATATDAAAQARMAELFSELHATVGAFFTESMGLIGETAAATSLPPETRRLIGERLHDLFGDGLEGRRFAVRSSGLDEDTAAASLAGVHRSVLGAEGVEGVLAAVEECRRSYYEPAAVAARVRAGDFDPRPRLALFVQEMVDPRLAGVAFTGLDGTSDDDDVVIVEYVEGLADGLVSGTAEPLRATSADLSALPEGHRGAIADVVRVTRALRAERGHDVDVEWAVDDSGVRLLQARPVTARRGAAPAAGPAGLWTARLYFDDLPAGAALHDVEEVYAGYSAKRGPAHRLAASLDVAVGAGWVVGFSPRVLRDAETAARLAATLAQGSSGECVLDFGDTLRQIVVPKEQVVDRLLEVAAGGGEDAGQTVVVRDFVRGQLGVISRSAGGGSASGGSTGGGSTGGGLVVEYTPEGLLALNRGTAGAEAVVVDEDGRTTAPEGAEPVVRHLDTIRRLTAAMRDRYGDVTLEWVLNDGELLFVDYSVLGADSVVVGANGALISAGTATGPLFTLDDDTLLSRLSVGPAVSINKSQDVSEYEGIARLLDTVAALPEPPVVRVARPYAVLSVLLDRVAGFVFEQGSALCHLAILLREAGVPAVAASGLADVPDGAQAVIADGSVTVASSVAKPSSVTTTSSVTAAPAARSEHV
ncbi:pyruvate phosphate dikinase PEP/pyruvate-binding protein [Actinobacteria bacterium OK074]|nr:pyruvate phosphate dikinase PEP/pyruvate-binding protein [Actinobacteria bacterium OK074]